MWRLVDYSFLNLDSQSTVSHTVNVFEDAAPHIVRLSLGITFTKWQPALIASKSHEKVMRL